MALMHLNFNSVCLSGNTDVNIVLPDLPRGVDPKEFYAKGKNTLDFGCCTAPLGITPNGCVKLRAYPQISDELG